MDKTHEVNNVRMPIDKEEIDTRIKLEEGLAERTDRLERLVEAFTRQLSELTVNSRRPTSPALADNESADTRSTDSIVVSGGVRPTITYEIMEMGDKSHS